MTKTPSRFMTAVVILQAGVILGFVAGNLRAPGVEAEARAQMIPDPAAQQMLTNELLKGIDAKLSRIASSLDGEIKVRSVEAPARAK